jgi:hypothetical protein
MRERAATLNLEDDDIVGIAVAPIVKSVKSVAPPLRKTSAPPPAPRVVTRTTTVPPAPESHIAMISRVPVPTTAKVATPGMAFPPVKVPSFDEAASVVAPPAWAAPEPASVTAPASVAPPVSVVPAPVAVVPAPPPPAPVTRLTAPSVSTMRLSVSDPTDLIFDGMYGLTFAKSMVEAAEMCAETLARALRARTVVIHARDLMSGELRAIGAHGDGDFDIIGSAEAGDDDLVASAVICNQKSVTMKFDGELPKIAPKRLHAVGSPRTLVAAPAMSWGRCVAIIEVIDADPTFAARVADSAAYVADHFAQFISAHAA